MTQETSYLDKLGVKLSDLRKLKGMTQEQVAKEIDMQRSAYALIELGKRNVSTRELYRLSAIFDFSIPEMLAELFGGAISDGRPSVIYEKRRMFNYLKFKTILLYILDKCKEKPNIGKVVLNKLLYYSDFNYFFEHRDYLTGLRYSKLPKGPVPGIDPFIDQMKSNMELKEVPVDYFGYPSVRYIPMAKPDFSLLNSEEIKIIDEVIVKYADMSAADISELSHSDPPWLETPNIGDEIDYNLVFKRNKPI